MNTQTLNLFDQIRQQIDRRLQIVEILHAIGTTHINENILNQILAGAEHQVSKETLRTDLFWPQDQGLVLVIDLSGLLLAELTSFGVQLIKTQSPSIPELENTNMQSILDIV